MGTLCAQTRIFSPENLTNRRLGFLSDASSVGWNPAILGMRPVSEILAAVPLLHSFSPNNQYGLFAKLGPLGAGYVLNADSVLASGELYAGVGFSLIDDILWVGGSARIVNPGNIERASFESLRWNASLAMKPFNGIFLSVSATTMGEDGFQTQRIQQILQHIRTSPNLLYWTASASYTPLEFISLFAHYTTAPNSAALGIPVNILPNALGLDVGASLQATLLGNPIILSGQYSFASSALRFGFEINVGFLGVGLLRSMPAVGDAGMTATVRLTTDPLRNTGQLLGYRVDDDGCRLPVDTSFARPRKLVAELRATNPDYARVLQELSPDPDRLYMAIQERYYKPRQQLRSIAGDAIDVVSRQGYPLQVLNVDNSRFPDITVFVRALDAEGRSIRGLGAEDFAPNDP
ncbi:MAG: hypothetical protein RML40_04235, partial [Bacteroidota bacterium]|nr:hypothetical protein [Candidatus Kapabacteria bacterium]MDW8219721.1 hypothetical protein [Bacteroidota bacterium]